MMYGKFHNEYFDYIRKGIEPNTEAKKIVFDIIASTTNVYEISYEFEDADDRIQEILIEGWIKKIENIKE